MEQGLGRDPAWFRLSAEACSAQAQSGVGLVHGIAHTLEGPLRAEYPDDWGHARLCSVFLWPVLDFDLDGEGKAGRLFSRHGVDADRILEVASELHDPDAYGTALPFLAEKWRRILRDQCTRTNVRLVRPGDLVFFEEWDAK